MNDNFEDINFEDFKIERKNIPFKITQIKLTNFHWNSGEIDVGMPLITSVELNCKYNFEKNTLDWNKTITHTYSSLKNSDEENTNSYTVEFTNEREKISKLEENDLRNFKNNYFTDENPEKFTHWEITYNTYFKIVGTYDQELEVFKKISEILNFNQIIKEETKKVADKLNQR